MDYGVSEKALNAVYRWYAFWSGQGAVSPQGRPTSVCTRLPAARFIKGSAPAKKLVSEGSLAGLATEAAHHVEMGAAEAAQFLIAYLKSPN
ncbi:MAG: hypothetical protein ACOY90_01500 [Candidatus Zhuqueibacterota bacterium]